MEVTKTRVLNLSNERFDWMSRMFDLLEDV